MKYSEEDIARVRKALGLDRAAAVARLDAGAERARRLAKSTPKPKPRGEHPAPEPRSRPAPALSPPPPVLVAPAKPEPNAVYVVDYIEGRWRLTKATIGPKNSGGPGLRALVIPNELKG